MKSYLILDLITLSKLVVLHRPLHTHSEFHVLFRFASLSKFLLNVLFIKYRWDLKVCLILLYFIVSFVSTGAIGPLIN